MCVLLGPDGRPMSVDVDNEPEQRPDPASIVALWPGNRIDGE
jgi:hypothetical protein